MTMSRAFILALMVSAPFAAEPHVVSIGGPRLIIDGGIVLPRSVSTVSLEVRNPGAAARLWAPPMLSCACAAVQPESETFPASGAVAVAMRVSWPLGHAPAEATAEMHFTTPDAAKKNAAATVTVQVRIEDYLLLDERAGTYRLANRRFADADSGWEVDLVRGRHPDVWDDLSAEVGDGGLLVSSTRIDDDHWRVHFKPTAAMPLGSFGCPLTLTFRHKGKVLDHRVERRVVGRIIGPLRAIPGEVLLGAIPAGGSVERTVRVHAVDGSAVTVGEVSVDAGIVTATVSKDDPSLITLRADAPSGLSKQAPVGGSLRISARSSAGTFSLRVLLVGTMLPRAATDTP